MDGALVARGYTSGAVYNPGDMALHTFMVRAVNGACGTDSVPVTALDGNNTPVAPTITGITDVDACAQSGIEVAYAAGAGCSAKMAAYNVTYKAPACASNGISCDTGTSLIHCLGTSETNHPNTINNSCADGSSGVCGTLAY